MTEAPIIHCPACLATARTFVEKIDVREQHKHYAAADGHIQEQLTLAASSSSLDYVIYQCNGCGLEYCDPMVAPDATWYGLAYQALNLYPHDRWEFTYIASRLSPSDRVLELGCGSGEFLTRCGDLGVCAFGLDFSQQAVDECVKRGLNASLLSIGAENVNQVSFAPTIVVAFHVLEHLDDPSDLFALSNTMMPEGGELWVSIPSAKRPTRFFGESEFLDAPPHHMTRWTEAALRELGLRAGWRLTEMHYEPIPIRAASWYFATRSPLYRGLLNKEATSPRTYERFLRWAIYPFAALRFLARRDQISGFTMAARFTRA